MGSGIAAVGRTRWWGRVLALGTFAVAAVLPASARELEFGPAPDWVRSIEVPLRKMPTTESTSGGLQYLLIDHQIRSQAGDRVEYTHVATRPVTGDGVEDAAHVQISFDPTYETLTLHSISVRRDGRVLARLNPASVHVLQREKDLEARIYDGRKTANVLLDDVRIGDVVEYDFSRRGVNPAVRGHAGGAYDLQWKVPTQRVYARLMVPEGHEPRFASHNTALKPEVRHHDGWVDYAWQESDVPPIVSDADEPGWYDPFPSVEWSDYADWAAVAAWAVPLYRTDADQGSELRAVVDAIAGANPTPQARLMAALNFVQREIRYLGIEVGAGSLTPRQPREVMKHRFGDCKDKALLFVWTLQALGIDAQPALVDTEATRGIEQRLPSPSVFDHVVVRARIDGRDVWLDPTRAPQKGTLETLTQADFGRALVIDPATVGLQAMADPRTAVRHRDIHIVFDATAGRGQPVTMQVTTVFAGRSADGMRDELAGNSRDDLQRTFLNFYANDYPGIATERPFSVSDDEAANRLTVTEHYRIADIWQHADAQKRFEASISGPDMASELRAPSNTRRSGPYALAFPSSLDVVTEIRLYKDWPLDIPPTSIDDPAFDYHDDVASSGKVVTMKEHFETRADHVDPDRVASYAAQVRKARESLGLRLFIPDATAGSVNLPLALLASCMVAAAAWLAWRLYRQDPAPAAPHGDAPRGIAGWLLLPALHVVLQPFILLKSVWRLLPVFDATTWSTLTVAGGALYSPWWAPCLLGELAATAVLVVGTLLLPVLFFRKRSSLPRVYIGWTCLAAVFAVVDQIATAQLPSVASGSDAADWSKVGRQVVVAVIWIGYFLRSRRVAATFVERLRPAPPAHEPEATRTGETMPPDAAAIPAPAALP